MGPPNTMQDLIDLQTTDANVLSTDAATIAGDQAKLTADQTQQGTDQGTATTDAGTLQTALVNYKGPVASPTADNNNVVIYAPPGAVIQPGVPIPFASRVPIPPLAPLPAPATS